MNIGCFRLVRVFGLILALAWMVCNGCCEPTGILLDNTNCYSFKGPGDFLANISAADTNLFQPHTFALVPGSGSDDNTHFSISGWQLRAASSLAEFTGIPQRIRLQCTDGAGLSVEQAFVLNVVSNTGRVVINEIHYNGLKNSVQNEFVELLNSGGLPVDLGGWRLSGAVDYIFPAGTSIPAGGYLVVAENPATITSIWSKPALGPYAGHLSSDGETVRLRNTTNGIVSEVDYKSGFPWPFAADGEGASLELINPLLDEALGGNWRASTNPPGNITADFATPGAQNAQFATNAPPAIRNVGHSPIQPHSGEPIVVTAKITDPDGVGNVLLMYQVVTPGNYIPSGTSRAISGGQFVGVTTANPSPPLPVNPAFEASTNWLTVPMTDSGTGADATIGDSIWTGVIPAQTNRTLVRYRIVATDNFGASIRAPYSDDPALNFACFVYDGVPDYQGTTSSNLTTLPVYHLLTLQTNYYQCVGYNSADRLAGNTPSWTYENWIGTFVYDGKVYDHVHYRLHGANGRYYASGTGGAQTSKRAFKFVFNKGNYFDPKDQEGKSYPAVWKTIITENLWENRATYTFSLNEVVNFYLWEQLGIPSPRGHWVHFRTIKQPLEQPDAWHGDFWGLMYLHEDYDGQFLKAHNLPDGNLYKLTRDPTGGLEQQRYQAPGAITDGSDHNNIEINLTGFSGATFITNQVNLTLWARYHALAEAIRHYDYWPSGNNNAAWYFYPNYSAANHNYGTLWTLPSDVDATWGPTWNNGHDVVHNSLFNDSTDAGGDSGTTQVLWPIYYNQVREIRDLLWQPDQISPLINQFAEVIRPFVNAEFARWRNAPSDAGNFAGLGGAGLSGATGQDSLSNYVADMIDFAFDPNNNGGSWSGGIVGVGGRAAYLDNLQAANAEGANAPARPTIAYLGSPGFPTSDLRFGSTAFTDGQGNNTFGALQWRVAEVNTNATYVPGVKRLLEVVATFDTGPITTFRSDYLFPNDVCQPGKRYRVRARHMDNTGRWSKWSLPVEFTPTQADDTIFRDNLLISEIMYHPLDPTTAEQTLAASLGQTWSDKDFEYLEMLNIGSSPLDLSGIRFSSGLNFSFATGTVVGAGQRLVLVANTNAFVARYGSGHPVTGQWAPNKSLGNGGDTLDLAFGATTNAFLSVTYDDAPPWPPEPDGRGMSLVLIAPETRPDPNVPENWRAVMCSTAHQAKMTAPILNRGRLTTASLALPMIQMAMA